MTLASAQRLLYLRGYNVYRPKTANTDLFKVHNMETNGVVHVFEYEVIALAERLKRKK